ncbi:MAG: hypothetical protein ACOC1I_04830, partial [Spirochaetota bacterium]
MTAVRHHMHERESDGEQTEQLLARAFAAIREYDLDAGLHALDEALATDFDDPDVIAALKYVNFWRERERQIDGIGHAFERGQYLLDQWPIFDSFVERVGAGCDPCLQAIRHYVFGTALESFER